MAVVGQPELNTKAYFAQATETSEFFHATGKYGTVVRTNRAML
jgi:hypothetical protein